MDEKAASIVATTRAGSLMLIAAELETTAALGHVNYC
jgi:hypothetical protein